MHGVLRPERVLGGREIAVELGVRGCWRGTSVDHVGRLVGLLRHVGEGAEEKGVLPSWGLALGKGGFWARHVPKSQRGVGPRWALLCKIH